MVDPDIESESAGCWSESLSFVMIRLSGDDLSEWTLYKIGLENSVALKSEVKVQTTTLRNIELE